MPKYVTAALLAVLLLFCAVFISGQSLPEPEPPAQTEAPESEPEVTEAPETPPEPIVKKPPPPKEVIDEADRIREALSAVMEVNPDAVAWINVPGTDIDYPVVLGEDNDFYLDHSAERQYYPLGAIFEDYEDQRNVDDNRNTVLYGHNVWYGGMFHDVEKFLERDFFENTPVYLYTMEKVYIYEPFSIFEASWEYQYFQIDFEDDDEFVAFLSEMRDNSRFKTDAEFGAEDKLLTLSTCTNGAKTQRWCFQSILVNDVDIDEWKLRYGPPETVVGHFDE